MIEQRQLDYIRPEVMAFARAMEDTLRKHDGKKTHWRDVSVSFGYLFGRISDELKEAKAEYNVRVPDYDKCIMELVDTANFCMMCYDKIRPADTRSHPTPAADAPDPAYRILRDELDEWEKENLCWSEVQDLQRRIRSRGLIQQHDAAIRKELLEPLQKIKEYDMIYYKTPERGKARCRVRSVSKNGKRIGIEYCSSSFAGGCSISKCIDISEVISVCREIPLRREGEKR